jgi:ribosomal protein S18 acetylase RimI-like enzyme
MTAPIFVREAKFEDTAVVVAFIGQLAESEGEHSPISETYVAEYLAFPGSKVLLAKRGQDAVGLISYSMRPNLYHAGDSCLVEELIVSQGARGSGVGRALMEEVIQRCVRGGCAEISVSTMPDNRRAIAFYKKLGFTDQALFLERHLEA